MAVGRQKTRKQGDYHHPMTVFCFNAYNHLLKSLETLCAIESGKFAINRFENGELHLELGSPVEQEHCTILGSIAPPGDQFLGFLLLADTLKREGARKVTALLPYLAYARQDKSKRGKSLATAWAGKCLQASGVDKVVTVDVHSERGQHLFPIPVASAFPDQIFARTILSHPLADATLVAPDNGAIWRCEAVNRALGRPGTAIAYFEKQRDEKGVTHTGLFGSVGRRAVIIDDMLDTGGTLVSACEQLVNQGTQEIYIMVTHGLFTGQRWKKLWSLDVRRIFCTDTIPQPQEIAEDPRITTLSIAPLLVEHLASPVRQ